MDDSTFWREFLSIQRQQLAELRAIRRALADDPTTTACPYCGEVDRERLEDTSTIAPRMTCLNCGKSWQPTTEAEEVA